MAVAEFEEKEFEGAFNRELPVTDFWSPGQVGEAKYGFDATFFFAGPFLFRGFGFERYPRGIKLNERRWLRFFNEADAVLPPFRLNLFIQYKRPARVRGHRAAEWSYWQRAYYRYDLAQHQLNRLILLEREIGLKGLVVYASPAFHTKSQLWANMRRRKLVDKTNYVRPTTIEGHHRYSYISAGTVGLACSEETPTSDPEFRDMLSQAWESNAPRAFSKLVDEAGGGIARSMVETEDQGRSTFQTISNYLQGDSRAPIIGALANIFAFNFVYGTSLNCLGGELI